VAIFHPHVHMLVTAGGLSADASSWMNSTNPRFLVPVRVQPEQTGLFQSGAEFSAEDHGEREQGARPGMQDGQGANACAHITGIAYQHLESVSRGFHQEPMNFLGMRAGQGAQLCGKGPAAL